MEEQEFEVEVTFRFKVNAIGGTEGDREEYAARLADEALSCRAIHPQTQEILHPEVWTTPLKSKA